MKRILLVAAMLLASALYASAEYSRYYVTETVTGRDGILIWLTFQTKTLSSEVTYCVSNLGMVF